MNTNRLWVIGSVVAMAVILVLGWIVGVQPQLTAAASATLQRVNVVETNTRYQGVLAKLKAEHDKLPELQQQLASLTSSVPADAESAAFVKELNGIAAEKGVIIRSLTFSDAVAYKPPVAAAPAPAASASGSTPAPTDTPAPAAPAAPVAPTAPAAVTNSLITPTNFVASPVQVGVRGSLAQVLDFLEGAQKGQRLFLVTSLSSTPSTDEGVPPGTVDATIGGYIYSVTSTSEAPAAPGTTPSGTEAEANASK
jgi:Tfp pilus assembly protein PilO